MGKMGPLHVSYPNFQKLQTLTKWAGFIGAVQAFFWLLLSSTGILFYHRILLSVDSTASVGMIANYVLYNLYFHGPTDDNSYESIRKDILGETGTVLLPSDLHIWIWVYIVTSVVWLISSIILIRGIPKDYLKQVNMILYIWIFVTLLTAAMDLGLCVIFGIDFGVFDAESMKLEAGKMPGAYMEGAKISAIILMVVSARGFILWIINVGFAAYFLKETITITEYISNENMSKRLRYTSDSHSTMSRGPIQAFDTNNRGVNDQQQQRQPDNLSMKINTAAIERASRMSNAVMQHKKLGGFSSTFSQYNEYPAVWKDPRYPEPDYTPPMVRSNVFMNNSIPEPIEHERPKSVMKNKRYF